MWKLFILSIYKIMKAIERKLFKCIPIMKSHYYYRHHHFKLFSLFFDVIKRFRCEYLLPASSFLFLSLSSSSSSIFSYFFYIFHKASLSSLLLCHDDVNTIKKLFIKISKNAICIQHQGLITMPHNSKKLY